MAKCEHSTELWNSSVGWSSHLRKKNCFHSFWNLPTPHFPTWYRYSEPQCFPSPGWQLMHTPWWLTHAVDPWLWYKREKFQPFCLCILRWLVKLSGSSLFLIHHSLPVFYFLDIVSVSLSSAWKCSNWDYSLTQMYSVKWTHTFMSSESLCKVCVCARVCVADCMSLGYSTQSKTN